MGGSVGHTPAATGGTKSTPLTRKWNKPVETAGITVHPQKAVGQYPALQERPQLPLDKPGYVALAQPLPFEEVLEVHGDNAIENAFRGISGTVIGRSLTDRGVLPLSLEGATLLLKRFA